ncbi:MAG: hypothetical protein WCL44_04920, partial [bacterium]
MSSRQAGAAGSAKGCEYAFDGKISREVLENYLSRAITMMRHGNTEDNNRMLLNIGAKFIGRVAGCWGGESSLPQQLEELKTYTRQMHALDPEMILQACIFEIISRDLDKLPVPGWVFDAFGLKPEKRNFSYSAMLYPDGQGKCSWSDDASVPDMNQLETRLWFFYAAASYINCGVEGIHFGQVELMDKNDPKHAAWWDLLSHIRSHAAAHARRHLVLCDAHTPSGGVVMDDGRLLLDFHAHHMCIEAVPNTPYKGILRKGYATALYGRSRGGITPSGWACESLPYLVEIDNCGTSGREGQDIGYQFIWGYDDICWFAFLPEAERNAWLWYAWQWLKDNDPNGHLQVPGSRCLASKPHGRDWYHANTRSAAVPDGFDTEEVFKE